MQRSSHARLISHAALLALHLFLLRMFAAPWPIIHGFPLDDAWIHQVVARTFATSGTLGYAPGHHGAGATSHLWAAVLSINFRWLHADPVAFTLGVNVAASCAASQCVLLVLWREVRPLLSPAACVAVTLAAFGGGNVLWFAYSGMEVMLFVGLAAAGVACFTDPAPSKANALGAGACAGLLTLTRPEAAAFAVLFVLFARRARRPWSHAALSLLPWVLSLALYFGSNALLLHTVLPPTLGGRRWLWETGTAGMSGLDVLLQYPLLWVERFRNYQLGTSSNVALWLSLGVAGYGAVRWVRDGGTGMRMLAAWAALHALIYAVLLPTPGHGGRYQPFVPIFYFGWLAFGCAALAREAASLLPWLRGRPFAHACALVVLLAGLLAPWVGLASVGVRDWRRDHAYAVEHIRKTEEGMARFVDALPEDAIVASYDIGGLGFRAHRPILDAGGLSDGAMASALRTGRAWQVLRERGVDYVVLPVAYTDDSWDPTDFAERLNLRHNPAVELEEIHELKSELDVFVFALAATWNASPRQALYRIRYTGLPGSEYSRAIGAADPPLDPEDVLSADDTAMLHNMLEVLSGAKVAVRLAVSREAISPASECPASTFCLELGGWGVKVFVPSSSPVPSEMARAAVAEAVAPYVDVSDYGGAGGMALHALARLIESHEHPGLVLPLAPIPRPQPNGHRSDIRDTERWGIPCALALFAGCLLWSAYGRRRGMGAGEPVEAEGGLLHA